MKIEFENHVPDYCDPRGCKREHLYFDSLDELLEAKKEWLIDEEHKDLIFACGTYNTLMVSSQSEEWWWVVGYVKGIDLSKYLPRFDEVYKPKMSKALEALTVLKYMNEMNGWFEFDFSSIEKSLKALEIIKDKEVNVFDILATSCADYYNTCIRQRISPEYCDSYFLTQEEYDLLKEVLL